MTELQKKINKYFRSCYKMGWLDESRRDEKTGEWIKDERGNVKEFQVYTKVRKETITVSGLALFLGMDVRELPISDSKEIKLALTRIRKEYEERAIDRCTEVDFKLLDSFYNI